MLLLLRPDLNEALFVNFGMAKALGNLQKSGSGGRKSAPKKNKNTDSPKSNWHKKNKFIILYASVYNLNFCRINFAKNLDNDTRISQILPENYRNCRGFFWIDFLFGNDVADFGTGKMVIGFTQPSVGRIAKLRGSNDPIFECFNGRIFVWLGCLHLVFAKMGVR